MVNVDHAREMMKSEFFAVDKKFRKRETAGKDYQTDRSKALRKEKCVGGGNEEFFGFVSTTL